MLSRVIHLTFVSSHLFHQTSAKANYYFTVKCVIILTFNKDAASGVVWSTKRTMPNILGLKSVNPFWIKLSQVMHSTIYDLEKCYFGTHTERLMTERLMTE